MKTRIPHHTHNRSVSGVIGAVLVTLSTASLGYCQFDLFDQAPEKPAWQQFKLDNRVQVTLDFRNASPDAVLRMLSQASGITIIKDPALTGNITLQSPRAQTLENAFALLNAVLGLKNFELQKQGNFLVVKPKQQRGFGGRGGSGMPQMNFDPSTLGGGSTNQLKVYQIKYANATQVARVINEVFATPPGGDTGGANPFAGGANPFAGGANPFAGGGGAGGGRRFGGGNFGGGNFGGGAGGGTNPFAALAQRFGGGRGGNTSTVKASADDYSNSVIVNAGSREQIQVAGLILQIDKQTDQPQQSKVFPLKYANANELASVVQNVLTSNAPRGRGGAAGQNVPIEQRFQQAFRFGNAQAAFGQVVADNRTNSLIVTGTQDNLTLVGQVIEQLDKEVSYVSSTFVVTLANARADQIAQLVNQSFGGRNGTNTNFNTNRNGQTTNVPTTNRNNTGNNRPATLGGGRAAAPPDTVGAAASRAVDPNSVAPGDTIDVPLANPEAGAGELATKVSVQQGGFGQFFGGGGGRAQTGNQRSTGTDQEGRIVNIRDLTGDVTAIPDINTNSVILVTSPGNRQLLEQILTQLDKIPEQVMIETLIVEASLDAANKFGVEWNLNQNKVLNNKNVKANSALNFGLQANTAQPQGFRYTLTGTQYSAFVQALNTDSRFDVLSTPRIFTSNNATAQINISQSLPYVVSQQVLANGNIAYNYAFLDVGIVLTVTPRITSNGYVTMDVTQTANDFVRYTDFNAPVVNQREAQTTVSVKDGETVVLGGIIKSSVSTTINKLPLLGDIPLLGNLFKSTSTEKNKTELLVFLTPRIVRDNADAQSLRSDTENQMQPSTRARIKETITREAPKPKPGSDTTTPKPGTNDKVVPPVTPPKAGESGGAGTPPAGKPNPNE